ncbi:threonine/serine exporter family protein [Peribacillus glennii]|uniref:Threonine/serine exporter n=1 Tax=Peribacillus glennii TaxID=2303991 RepID=A0A372LA42_9BACI|nr:threonine/serine exporter family protein [Peribacillus glennii]RFU62437.1 threonine/serine exporter [Peribacillus glennii]
MIAQLFTSFIASAAFGILFNVPKQSLVQCGFVGMAGWLLYCWFVWQSVDSIIATLAAAFLVALISQLFAKMYKTPIIIFSVSGIIPLVPGGLAYDAMRRFVSNDYSMAVELAAKALMLSGAIAMGLIFSEVMNQISKKYGKIK